MPRPFSGLFHRNSKGVETPIELENAIDDEGQDADRIAASAGTLRPMEQSPEVKQALQEAAQLRQELAAERKQREDERLAGLKQARDASAAKIKADATQFAAGQVKASRLMPAGQKAAESLHAFVHLSAAGLPTDGIDAKAALDEVFANTPPHSLTAEGVNEVPEGAMVLDNGATGDGKSPEEMKSWAKQVNDRNGGDGWLQYAGAAATAAN